MTVLQLADIIKKYGLEERGNILYYNSNNIGVYGCYTYKGVFINFYDCDLEKVFNPIACDCKIKNMIKFFKEQAIKHKMNEIEKDFV